MAEEAALDSEAPLPPPPKLVTSEPLGGGDVEEAELEFDQEALLSKLDEQNRLLEEDSRSRTAIMPSPTTSSSSLHSQSHDTTPKSHDQLGSKDSLRDTPSSRTTTPTFTATTTITTPSKPSTNTTASSHGNDLSHQTAPPSLRAELADEAAASSEATTPSEEATPPKLTPDVIPLSPPIVDGPSQALPSPTEVRSKPQSSAYSCPTHSLPSIGGEEEEEEEEGLGPEVSIMLGDNLETRIPYHEVMSGDGTRGSVGTFSPEDNEPNSSKPSPEDASPETTPTATTAGEKEEVSEPADSESRDIVMDLPSTTSTNSLLGKGKRLRSETESRGAKVNILPFKGRKRSQTLQEGGVVKEKDEIDDGVDDRLLSEETQWQQWSDILKNWEEVSPKNSKLVKHLARQGIPEHLRGMAWQLLSNSINPELKERYPSLIIENSPHERAIRRDLNRTFPEHDFFKKHDGLGQESLCNVLKAYSVYDREVGYCQGSPFVAGMLLMQMPEEEAFCVLVQLMQSYKMRDLYKPSMADLSLCFYQLDKLVEEFLPALSMHFKAVGFQPSMYASPWFLTLFASVLSLTLAFRVLDLVLVEGRDIIFRVGLALLDSSQQQLLQMDMEDMIKHFQKELKTNYEDDPDSLISKALKIKLNVKKMKKFGKEYLDKKAKKTLEISEMARLQTENMEANQKLMKLQQEYESLKEELIAGRVTHAQDGMEIVQLRNELAITRKKLAKLESQGMEDHQRCENNIVAAAVPEWAETNGQSTHDANRSRSSSGHVANDISSAAVYRNSPPRSLAEAGKTQPYSLSNPTLFDIYKDSSVSPQDSPIIRGTLHNKGSKENLFYTEETPDVDTAPSPILGVGEEAGKKKKKKKKLLGRSKSDKRAMQIKPLERPKSFEPPHHHQEHDSTGTPPPLSPETLPRSKKEGKKKKEKLRDHSIAERELEKALALSKLECADYANQMELKALELMQALQREAFLVRELKQGRAYLNELEAKITGGSSELLCMRCQGAVDSPLPASGEKGEEGGPNSTQAILTNLRALWQSSPHKDLT